MTHDEVLKRISGMIDADREYAAVSITAALAALSQLRADLAEERCDNCLHWHLYRLTRHECALLSNHPTAPYFRCAHFTKVKKETI